MFEDCPNRILDCKICCNECLRGHENILSKLNCVLFEAWIWFHGVMDNFEDFLEDTLVETYVNATYAQNFPQIVE